MKEPTLFSKIYQKGKSFFQLLDEVNRHNATEKIEWEAAELNNIFSILVLGVFIGLPAPPMQLTLELLPDMEQELLLMLQRVETANEPLATLYSVLSVD